MGFISTPPASPMVINILDFGAKGDGVFDCTSAIQNAILAASALGGGLVFVPRGIYLVSACIYLLSGVELVGAGRFVSTIKAVASGGNSGSPSPSTWVAVVGAVNQDHVGVRDLGVNANGVTADGIGILGGSYVYEVDKLCFRRCGTLRSPLLWRRNSKRRRYNTWSHAWQYCCRLSLELRI